MKRYPLADKFPCKPEYFQVLYHEDCLLHESSFDHPETPQRLESVLRGCEQNLQPGLSVSFVLPRPANFDELEIVHDRDYLRRLEDHCLSGKSTFMCEDTYVCFESPQAILAAAACSLNLGELLLSGGRGFALCRPPGHHAGRGRAEGFCFVNHLALAAEKIRLALPKSRILAVDFDVHHGNGTHSIYKQNPQVFFFSQHGSPAHIYPYSGYEEEQGQGTGLGFTCNITLPRHTSGDQWLESFSENLRRCSAQFKPDFLLVSAGFDAHIQDPFSLMLVEDKHYLQALQALKETAAAYCDNRLGLFLEGGYSCEVLQRLVPAAISLLASPAIRPDAQASVI